MDILQTNIAASKFFLASQVGPIIHVLVFHPSLRSGRDWGEVRGEQEEEKEEGEEEEGRRVCCCPELVGVKIIIAVFAVFNLGIIATGEVITRKEKIKIVLFGQTKNAIQIWPYGLN